jgi:hypothetical protein
MPVPALIKKFLDASIYEKILVVAFIIGALFLISMFITIPVTYSKQLSKQRLTIKEAPGMMPMYQRVARYWQ